MIEEVSTAPMRTRSGDPLPQGSGMGGGIVAGVFPQADSLRPTIYGERWAVVAGHPLVSDLAADILRHGGNAIDAGVAAGFASNVVQVDMCNLGGIAPILVRTPTGDGVEAIAGIGVWGAQADLETIRDEYDGALPLGGAPSIVPGAVSGWLTALRRHGTLPLEQVLAAAIGYAEDGFLLDPRTAAHLGTMGASLAAWESTAAIFQPDGRPLRAGERLRQPALARTLRRLSDAAARVTAAGGSREEGIAAAHAEFYGGDIARTIVDFTSARGGTLAVSDLEGFEADVSPAPAVRFGRWRVHTTPTWSQGPIIGQALGMLERRGIRDIPFGSTRYAHEVVESLKVAFSERERSYGDPRFTGVGERELFADEHLDDLAARIGERALPNLPTVPQAGPRLPSTTSIVVVDADGFAFSSSPSDTLDGGPIIPELGIMCSPRGVQSRLIPGHPNALRPGGRPCVTPAAVIALDDADAIWATACPGGDVIVQAITQAMVALDVYDRAPQAAVEAPRLFGSSYPGGFHPHPVGDSLVFLEAGFDEGVADDLEARGHRVVEWPANEFDAGSVQTVLSIRTPAGDRLIAAGADSRRIAYAYAR